jgi:CRISPR/Cas system-associated exonuclease Cas4 (RecB family)
MEVFSKSRIGCYKACPKHYELQYVRQITAEEPHNDDVQYGSWIHKVLELYNPELGNEKQVARLFRDFDIRSKPFRDSMPETFKNAINFTKDFWKYPRHTEENITYQDDNVSIRGVIDLRLERKDGEMMIVDYKSAKAPAKERHAYQMKMYAFMVSEAYNIKPEKLKLMIYYPRINSYDYYTYNQIHINGFKDELYHDIEKIEESKIKKHFETTPGFHCKWCSYGDFCGHGGR